MLGNLSPIRNYGHTAYILQPAIDLTTLGYRKHSLKCDAQLLTTGSYTSKSFSIHVSEKLVHPQFQSGPRLRRVCCELGCNAISYNQRTDWSAARSALKQATIALKSQHGFHGWPVLRLAIIFHLSWISSAHSKACKLALKWVGPLSNRLGCESGHNMYVRKYP